MFCIPVRCLDYDCFLVLAASDTKEHAELTVDMIGRSYTYAKYASVSLTEYAYLLGIGRFCETPPCCLLSRPTSSNGLRIEYSEVNSTVNSVERVLAGC